MAQFNLAGVQTPLVPLGSRQMGVYRHIDLNLSVNTLADLDLDVEGLSWAIFGNNPQSDFYPHLRIDAAHSRFFPDEIVSPQTLLPNYPISGLSTASFATNVLDPNNHPEETLFEGAYTVNPNQIFTAPSGMKMISYPTFADTYTWRDSSFTPLALGGPNGNGVNPDQYFVVLGQPIPTPPAPLKPYSVAKVPSVASPLLFDFRTYPSSDPATKGLNGYHVALACTVVVETQLSGFLLGWRRHARESEGGRPRRGPRRHDPDRRLLSPGSTTGTPGTKTIPDGPELYQGRVDFGVKHSRVYTHYFDLGSANTHSPMMGSSSMDRSRRTRRSTWPTAARARRPRARSTTRAASTPTAIVMSAPGRTRCRRRSSRAGPRRLRHVHGASPAIDLYQRCHGDQRQAIRDLPPHLHGKLGHQRIAVAHIVRLRLHDRRPLIGQAQSPKTSTKKKLTHPGEPRTSRGFLSFQSWPTIRIQEAVPR